MRTPCVWELHFLRLGEHQPLQFLKAKIIWKTIKSHLLSILIKYFLLSVSEAAKALLHTIKRHYANWKLVCFHMTACFLNCMWRMSKIPWNQGFPAFIEMINIQQSNYMLGTNDLLSIEHSPALLDFAEVCNTDLKGRKKNKIILSVVRKTKMFSKVHPNPPFPLGEGLNWFPVFHCWWHDEAHIDFWGFKKDSKYQM